MRFDRDAAAGGPIVQGFARGGFSVDGGIYRGLLLTPKSAMEWQEPPALGAIDLESLASILDLQPEPEFLLLGSGAAFAFPPSSFRAALDARGIGLEVMDSRAAARSWGMLRSEERWIVAALMPLDQS